MINTNAKTLIGKANQYTIEEFESDFDDMICAYNALPELDVDKIRNQIYTWDFEINKDLMQDFDSVCESYARFIEYQNSIVSICDLVRCHNNLLEFIIENAKEIASQFFTGTAKSKDARTSTLLLSINLEHNKVSSLLSFVNTTQKAIEFNAQQLARILREREAMARVNEPARTTGMAKKYAEIEVKTKNKFG